MLKTRSIVISGLSGLCALLLWGCGQKGNLYLPTSPDATHRATLPQTVLGPALARTPAPTPSQVQPGIAAPEGNTSGLPSVQFTPIH